MANSTEYENSTSASDVTLWNAYSTSMAILAGINTFLAITASLGNALILIALHKVTSIYPPTKLLFRCLAVTDLLVGLISQPLYVTILLKYRNSHCSGIICNSLSFKFLLNPAFYVWRIRNVRQEVTNTISKIFCC